MKKLLIVGLGVVLMGMQVNVLAVTCATEKKGKGYTLRVLSPGPGTVINKSAPFLLQWQDPAQSLGIKVHVGLHQLKGTKKVNKAVKKLMNRPNTGNVLVTGTNLTQPGPKAKARDKYFLRITSGKTKQFIDSECFAFAPALKGVPKQAADAEQQGLQLTMQAYATQIAALTKELAALTKELGAVKKQLAAKGTGSKRPAPWSSAGYASYKECIADKGADVMKRARYSPNSSPMLVLDYRNSMLRFSTGVATSFSTLTQDVEVEQETIAVVHNVDEIVVETKEEEEEVIETTVAPAATIGGGGGGAQGPKGDKGDTGPQGPAGKDGAGGGGLDEAQVTALIAKHISVSGSAPLPQNYGCG